MVRAVEKLEVKFLQDIPAFVYTNMSDIKDPSYTVL